MPEREFKFCLFCKKKFFKTKRHGPRTWENTRFCCKKCHGEWLHAQAAALYPAFKLCPCGNAFTKKQDQSWSDYAEQKYCSRVCFHRDKDGTIAFFPPYKSEEEEVQPYPLVTSGPCPYYPWVIIRSPECQELKKIGCETCKIIGRPEFSEFNHWTQFGECMASDYV